MMEYYETATAKVYPIIFKVNYGTMTSINCYLYEEKNRAGVTLIDAGIDTPAFQTFFQEKLREFGFEMKDIHTILLTHYHEDHTGVVNEILKHHRPTIYAHEKAIERLHFEPSFLERKLRCLTALYNKHEVNEWGDKQLQKIKQTITVPDPRKIEAPIVPLVEGDCIGPFTVLEVPGHSPDSIAFWDAQSEWLFVGDLVMKTGSSSALIDFDEHGQLLLVVQQQEKSLRRILNIDPIAFVFAGHQEPFDNVEEILVKNMNRIMNKSNRIQQAILEGHHTALEIAQFIYREKATSELFFILSEIVGYLLYGQQRGEIEEDLTHSPPLYRIKDA